MEFRFKKDDIFKLAAALQLPEVSICQNGVVLDSVERLCIVLRYLPILAGMQT